MTNTDRYTYDEADVVVTHENSSAAGAPAVLVSLRRSLEQMGPVRTARTLLKLNQRKGFDWPGCAWPETPGHRRHAEFCENGAKAVAEEATTRRVGPEFFAAHPVSELLGKTDYWLGQQGRLTHPMVLRPGASHYTPIGWEEAFALIADELNGLESRTRRCSTSPAVPQTTRRSCIS
jgi:anaerobic selenocysteine-containing dehydrogenase